MRSAAKHTFIERIVCVGLEEEVLEANHHRVEVQHGFPVFTKYIEANIAFQVDIWMINLYIGVSRVLGGGTKTYAGLTLDLWRVVWVVTVDGEGEAE